MDEYSNDDDDDDDSGEESTRGSTVVSGRVAKRVGLEGEEIGREGGVVPSSWHRPQFEVEGVLGGWKGFHFRHSGSISLAGPRLFTLSL